MLVHLIEAVILFFVVRFFAALYIRRPIAHNAIATGALGLFVIALWAHGVWYRSHVPGAATQAAAPAGDATRPTMIVLPHSEVIRLSAEGGPPALGAVDAVTMHPDQNDAPPESTVRSGSVIFIRGWTAAADKTPFQGFIVVIDNRVIVDGTAHYGGERPDVAKAYNAADMTYTGFSAVAVPTTGLRKGPHHLQIAGLSTDRKHYVLVPAPVNFIVR